MEKLELVQKARLGLGYDSEATVLNRCDIQRLWIDVESRPATRRAGIGRAWTAVGASIDEPGRRQAEHTTRPRRTGARRAESLSQRVRKTGLSVRPN